MRFRRVRLGLGLIMELGFMNVYYLAILISYLNKFIYIKLSSNKFFKIPAFLFNLAFMIYLSYD